jgi:hypothetical protein
MIFIFWKSKRRNSYSKLFFDEGINAGGEIAVKKICPDQWGQIYLLKKC